MSYLFICVLPIIAFGFYILKKLFGVEICHCTKRLDGKVVIITGANCGIGYETALDIAKRGARVILACRDLNKAQKAADKIILESNNNNVDVEQLDLASLESIRHFCQNIRKKINRLDVLINNAGINVVTYTKTIDGYETNFQVNYLGPFYLTNLLIDLLKSSAPSRIVNVSSIAHYVAKMNWNDLMFEKSKFIWLLAYNQSKLAGILFTKKLAEKYKNDCITAVCLHPGAVKTDLFRDIKESRAQTSIYCAVSDEIVDHSGCYYNNCKLETPGWNARDKQSADRLWDISSKLVGLQ